MNLEISFLVPTKTGLNKSIIDAYGSFRDSSKKKVRVHGYLFKIHDKDKSALFPNSKVFQLK